jgi:hypothetical protein
MAGIGAKYSLYLSARLSGLELYAPVLPPVRRINIVYARRHTQYADAGYERWYISTTTI